MRRGVLLLAALGLLWTGAAVAQSVKSIVEAFDYLGRWATDCAQPASGSNTVLRVSVLPSGLVEHHYDFGNNSEVNEIYEARRTGADELTLLIRFHDGRNREQIIVRQDGRLRTMSYRTPNGPFLTQNGIILAIKSPTAPLTHCH